ncbi:uncharacterized protein [Triticum aestivum]|uniref:uncharacterized protein n=1 Tax=Triticum aestivum TaxID=4565 RepID=UPI001D0308E3|nr:uncharacterized protein LOC123071064 [Triticum aestivum]
MSPSPAPSPRSQGVGVSTDDPIAAPPPHARSSTWLPPMSSAAQQRRSSRRGELRWASVRCVASSYSLLPRRRLCTLHARFRPRASPHQTTPTVARESMAGKTNELQPTAGPKAKPAPAAAMMEVEVEELPKAMAGIGQGGGQRCGGQGRHGRFHHSAYIFIHCLSTKFLWSCHTPITVEICNGMGVGLQGCENGLEDRVSSDMCPQVISCQRYAIGTTSFRDMPRSPLKISAQHAD